MALTSKYFFSESKYIWLNGKATLWENANIHILTHGLHYGSSVFEGIRVYKTKKGPAILFLDKHIDRFFYSAKRLGLDIKYTKDEIKKAIIENVKSNQIQYGYIRPIAFYGYGVMGINPGNCPTEVAISSWSLPKDFSDISPFIVKVSKYRRINSDTFITDAKIGGHYVNGIIANLEFKEETEKISPLHLDKDNYLAEGSGENLFFIKDKIVYTPELGSILPGITREYIIYLCNILGYTVKVGKYTVTELENSDEAFFCGSGTEIKPFKKINSKEFKLVDGRQGEVTKLISSLYKRAITGEVKEEESILTYL